MEKFIEAIEDTLNPYDFNRDGNLWKKNVLGQTPGQVMVVNNVRQEIPGRTINIELRFEIFGESELMDMNDNVEQRYANCSIDVIQEGESMGEICQLFPIEDPSECIQMIKQIFRM